MAACYVPAQITVPPIVLSASSWSNEAPDGFLVHCFAGDDPIACKDYVREKLGLPAFKSNGGNGRHRASDDAVERALMAAVQGQADSKPKGRIVASYDYTDADGTLLYQVLRLEPKSFRQRKPDGNGGWNWSLGGARRIPYRWPELLQFPDATCLSAKARRTPTASSRSATAPQQWPATNGRTIASRRSPAATSSSFKTTTTPAARRH